MSTASSIVTPSFSLAHRVSQRTRHRRPTGWLDLGGERDELRRALERDWPADFGRADGQLEAAGLAALPDGLTLHALRRTFASILFAVGCPAPYVMAQMGHTDATMTLGLYAKVMNTSEDDQAALARLVSGDRLAVDGSGVDSTAARTPETAEAITAEIAQ